MVRIQRVLDIGNMNKCTHKIQHAARHVNMEVIPYSLLHIGSDAHPMATPSQKRHSMLAAGP